MCKQWKYRGLRKIYTNHLHTKNTRNDDQKNKRKFSHTDAKQRKKKGYDYTKQNCWISTSINRVMNMS